MPVVINDFRAAAASAAAFLLCGGVRVFRFRALCPTRSTRPSSICIRWKKKTDETTDDENKRHKTPPKIKTTVKIKVDPFLFFGCFLRSELRDVGSRPQTGRGGPHRSFVNAQFRLECIWLSLHPHPRPTCYCRRGRVQYPFMISSTTTVRKTETKEEGKKTVAFRIRYVYIHTSYILCAR